MTLLTRIIVVMATVSLASCGKEPTETQKAQLEPLLMGCLISVNPTSLDDINPFSALARLGNLSEVTNKKWSLSNDERLVTASFRSDTTAFECDFVINQEAEWEIEKVRRNGEEVYDRATAVAKRAELEAQKKAKEEAERIQLEKQKEKERQAEISKWREKGYSNATYKYYAKYPSNWTQNMWDSPELRIVCGPDYPRFQFDDSNLSMTGRTDVEFQFTDADGNVTKTLFDLTSSGDAGDVSESIMGEVVRRTEEQNAKAVTLLKTSTSLKVDGITFSMDDIGQILCIQPKAEAERAALRAEKLEREEERRLEREKKKEAERLGKIAVWRERGYSNVTYKYYAKYPYSWTESMWNSPELRIVCDPDYPRFQLDDSEIRMMGRADVEFKFKDSQGKVTKTLIDLTSSGNAGEAYESIMGEDVRSTKGSNARAIKILKASSSVEVSGMTFTVDDISQVPCI